jgi:hypothetical protein
MSVLPGEKLTRFIRYSGHFSDKDNTVKREAFLPHKNSVDLSVFRISGLSESEVWAIGREYVERGGRPIKARADLSAGDVYENNLKVIPDEQGHELHANITPFPIDRSPTDRRTRRTIARNLALASKLAIMPTE